MSEILDEMYVVRREDGYYLSVGSTFQVKGYHRLHIGRLTLAIRPPKNENRRIDETPYVEWYNFYEDALHPMGLEKAQAAAAEHGGKVYKLTTYLEEYGG